MLSAAVRAPPINRSLPPIPDDEVSTSTTIRRPRVPRMGTCVPLRPPASSTASNSRSPQQSRSGVAYVKPENSNSCEIAVNDVRINEDDEYELRASSAPSEHSYAEYLTTPLRPLTQRRSPSPENPRRLASRLHKEAGLTHHPSRRSRSSNAMATATFANHDIINGMYRLKLKRSNETPFSNEFLGNKSLIRRYRQRRGQKRYRSKEDRNQVSADPEYDTVETGEEGMKNENQAPLSRPLAEIIPTSPVVGHHTTRSTQRRSGKHHQQSNYDSPCRLVTMLVI